MAEEKTKKEEIYYELMPHKKIKNIKKEIDNLKKKAEKESFSSKSFMNSVNSLTGSMDSLMDLFKEATEGMKLEEQAEEEVSKKIAPLLARMDDIEEQNRKIAQGIVAIADMVSELKEEMEKKPAPPPKPMSRSIPKPKIIMPPRGPVMPPIKEKPTFGQSPMPPPSFPPPEAGPGPRTPPWEKPGPGLGAPLAPPPASAMEKPPTPKKKGLLGGLFKK